MTALDFRSALDRLKLSQRGFASRVGDLAGEPLPYRTVQNWALGERAIPPTVPALLALLERDGA